MGKLVGVMRESVLCVSKKDGETKCLNKSKGGNKKAIPLHLHHQLPMTRKCAFDFVTSHNSQFRFSRELEEDQVNLGKVLEYNICTVKMETPQKDMLTDRWRHKAIRVWSYQINNTPYYCCQYYYYLFINLLILIDF